jgi:hypothetical protein
MISLKGRPRARRRVQRENLKWNTLKEGDTRNASAVPRYVTSRMGKCAITIAPANGGRRNDCVSTQKGAELIQR